MTPARLIIDPPAAGSWNMAVDEALLRSAGDSRQLTLRLYQWAQPTLSLGYFQPFAARSQHSASQGCPVVRRATGGGAIVHDHELTYSLTAPVRDRIDQLLLQWYDLIHGAWVATLDQFGLTARLCPHPDRDREQSFLCFHRRSAGDLLLGTAKVGGSAQRRHRHAALQHGSLLLDQSSAAPELPGITQLSGVRVTTGEWQTAWLQELSRRLAASWEMGTLTGAERAAAEELERDRFGCAKWTRRR